VLHPGLANGLLGRTIRFVALAFAAGATPHGQGLADLLAAAKIAGEVLAFENDYVRVRDVALEYPAAERAVAESRPVVLFIRVKPESGAGNTQLLDLPRGARPSRQTGTAGRGVIIEVLKQPPAVSPLRDPEADPPRDAVGQMEWEGGRLLVATFEPLHYGDGTGSSPSVTTFLSDGWVEVSSRGVRRRMGVRAGDAFWFEARTQITVVSDHPVGAAIVQLYPRRQGSTPSLKPPGYERRTSTDYFKI
jgi:hypothetical protein